MTDIADHPDIYTALNAAQIDCGPLYKNATNPFHKNKYADLNSVLKLIEKPCQEHGLMFFQMPSVKDHVPVLTTTLVHLPTKETIESDHILVSLDKSQDVGSAITYARRYALVCLFALNAEDDDGNRGSQLRTTTKDEANIPNTPSVSSQATPNLRKNPPTPGMWTAEVANACLTDDLRKRKKMLLRLGNEAVSWRVPSYLIELRDKADDESFSSWLEATAANAGVTIA